MHEVAFVAGQPLGYYGSWSLFSLSHHFLVWLAAQNVQPSRNTPFSKYAILGDDKVSSEYRRLLDKLGVTISLSKSIISSSGAIEFAKKFWVKGMQVDLSPVSLKSLLCARSTIGLCQIGVKYDCNINILQRNGGAGYRVRSRLMSTQSQRWERLKAAFRKPHGQKEQLPLELWIGRGYPLNPYLRGKIIAYLRRELKQQEIRLPPEQLLFDGEVEFNERTVLRKWMCQWLDWVYWYYSVALNENVSIEELFDAPMCATSWKRTERDNALLMFGFIWKVYDMAAGWSMSTTPPYVFDPATKVQFDRWILGGCSGTDFIMAPVD